jgi:hypothetical protein
MAARCAGQGWSKWCTISFLHVNTGLIASPYYTHIYIYDINMSHEYGLLKYMAATEIHLQVLSKPFWSLRPSVSSIGYVSPIWLTVFPMGSTSGFLRSWGPHLKVGRSSGAGEAAEGDGLVPPWSIRELNSVQNLSLPCWFTRGA